MYGGEVSDMDSVNPLFFSKGFTRVAPPNSITSNLIKIQITGPAELVPFGANRHMQLHPCSIPFGAVLGRQTRLKNSISPWSTLCAPSSLFCGMEGKFFASEVGARSDGTNASSTHVEIPMCTESRVRCFACDT